MKTIFHGQSGASFPLSCLHNTPCHQKPKGSSWWEYVHTKEAVTIATVELWQIFPFNIASPSSLPLPLFLLCNSIDCLWREVMIGDLTALGGLVVWGQSEQHS